MHHAETVFNLLGKFARALHFQQPDLAVKCSHLVVGGGADRTGQAVFEDDYRPLFRASREIFKRLQIRDFYEVIFHVAHPGTPTPQRFDSSLSVLLRQRWERGTGTPSGATA